MLIYPPITLNSSLLLLGQAIFQSMFMLVDLVTVAEQKDFGIPSELNSPLLLHSVYGLPYANIRGI